MAHGTISRETTLGTVIMGTPCGMCGCREWLISADQLVCWECGWAKQNPNRMNRRRR